MLVIDQWVIPVCLAIVGLVVIAVVHELMRPWVMQRKREVECDHQFVAYAAKHRNKVLFHVMFCPKCGARRMGGTDIDVGVVETRRPKVKQLSGTKQVKVKT